METSNGNDFFDHQMQRHGSTLDRTVADQMIKSFSLSVHLSIVFFTLTSTFLIENWSCYRVVLHRL